MSLKDSSKGLTSFLILNLKIKDLIDKKDSLEEENYTLKSYLKDKNLEKDYQTYTRNLNLQNIYEIER